MGFTDKKKLSSNLLYFPEIRINLDVSGLLQGKFVINEVMANDFNMDIPRSTPGQINEDIVEKSETFVSKELDDDKILAEIEKAIPQVAAAKELKTTGLKTDKHIEKIQLSLEEGDKLFTQSNVIKEVEQKVDEIKNKIKQAKKEKNFLKKAKKVLKATKESKKTINYVNTEVKKMKNAISSLSNDLRSIDDVIKSDLNNLENTFSLKNINIDQAVKSFLVGYVTIKLRESFAWAIPYLKVLTEEIRKKEEKKAPINIKNKVYQFPKVGSLPTFWLKEFAIENRTNSREFSFRVNDISSNPEIINKRGLIAFNFRIVGEEFYQGKFEEQKKSWRGQVSVVNKKISKLSLINNGNKGLSLDYSLSNWELEINKNPDSFLNFKQGFQDNLFKGNNLPSKFIEILNSTDGFLYVATANDFYLSNLKIKTDLGGKIKAATKGFLISISMIKKQNLKKQLQDKLAKKKSEITKKVKGQQKKLKTKLDRWSKELKSKLKV